VTKNHFCKTGLKCPKVVYGLIKEYIFSLTHNIFW